MNRFKSNKENLQKNSSNNTHAILSLQVCIMNLNKIIQSHDLKHKLLLFFSFSGKGFDKIYRDVQACGYGDVHVMWSILQQHSHQQVISHKLPSSSSHSLSSSLLTLFLSSSLLSTRTLKPITTMKWCFLPFGRTSLYR